MQNIELKVKVVSFTQIIRLLRVNAARKIARLQQVDTYYKCTNGRLKLREININNKKFELIWYSRPNTTTSKVSDYTILVIPKQRVIALKKILKTSFGELVTVKKVRQLWTYKHTRIHLDIVEKLGKYLELETVIQKQSLAAARKEHREVIDLLHLAQYTKHRSSYSDMLLRRRT